MFELNEEGEITEYSGSEETGIVIVQKGRGLSPVLEWLDTMDLIKESAKGDLSSTMTRFFSRNANDLAEVIIRDSRNKEKKGKKMLTRLLFPLLLKKLESHKMPSIVAGLRRAKKIHDRIMKQREVKKASNIDPEYMREFKEWLGRNYETMPTEITQNIEDLFMQYFAEESANYVDKKGAMIRTMFLNGVDRKTIKDQLVQEIKEAKKETGTYFNALNGSGNAYLMRAADEAANKAFAVKDMLGKMRWVAFFTKTCPDCIERHGKIKTFKQWQMSGVPRSGVTVCRQHCHCVLLPEEYKIDVKEAMKRESARL